jgi:hypothetical protein
MQTVSFLLVFLISAHLAFSYSLVLKSGKLLQGEYFAEEDLTVRIKDENGIILSIKKSNLDLEATKRINELRSSSKGALPVAQVSKQPKGSSQIVQDISERGRVYAQEDLAAMPEVSILGTEKAVEVPVSEESIEIPSKAEQYWRKEGAALRKKLETLKEKRVAAQGKCEGAQRTSSLKIGRPHRNPTNLIDLMDAPPACQQWQELASKVQEAEDRWAEFEIRARKAGVPWQWIE